MKEQKPYTREDMISFARYVWYNKSLSDYSKGLTHYFEEWGTR